MLQDDQWHLEVSTTAKLCPIGETVGKANRVEKKIPVLSCEGACIRGEIARQAANRVGKQPNFGRACHGELLAAPDSAISRWVKTAKQVVLIDGCFLRCHGRIIENLLDKAQLVQFDALSHYNKYCEIFDPDEVPEAERLEVAHQVAEWVLASYSKNACCIDASTCDTEKSTCCG